MGEKLISNCIFSPKFAFRLRWCEKNQRGSPPPCRSRRPSARPRQLVYHCSYRRSTPAASSAPFSPTGSSSRCPRWNFSSEQGAWRRLWLRRKFQGGRIRLQQGLRRVLGQNCSVPLRGSSKRLLLKWELSWTRGRTSSRWLLTAGCYTLCPCWHLCKIKNIKKKAEIACQTLMLIKICKAIQIYI